MSERKTTFQTRMPANRVEWEMLTMTLSAALLHALDDVAALHNDKLGPWLDDLEHRLIREAKNGTTGGASIELEAPASALGIEVLQGILNRLRLRLVHEPNQA